MSLAPTDQAEHISGVPVIATLSTDYAKPLADALLEVDLPIVETTFPAEAAAEAMPCVSQTRPELLMGAVIVLSATGVSIAVGVRTAFGLAPGPEVTVAADELGPPLAPGIMTPNDISLAADPGRWLMKFFPAMIAAVGGTWIAKPADMEAGDWTGVATCSRHAVARAQEIRG